MSAQPLLPPKRLYNLDYLRGMAAFCIMVVHLFTLGFGPFPSQTLPGRFAVYGVSIFYVLSGLTLFFVHFNTMQFNRHDLGNFFLRRFLRIFPLLWLVTLLTMFVRDIVPPDTRLVYNLTGLFAVIDRHGYIAPGAWTIGNELIFYLFFPVFVILAKKSRLAFYLLSGAVFLVYLYFAFFKLNPSVSYLDQWLVYINPLNQLFLFLAGFLMGYLFHKKTFPPLVSPICLGAGLALLLFYPAAINIAAGTPRLVFTAASLLICFAFYKTTLRFKGLPDRILTGIGESSYSVYLLHPIIWYSLQKLTPFNTITLIVITILITLPLSYFLYKRSSSLRPAIPVLAPSNNVPSGSPEK